MVWLISFAAWLITRFEVGVDGRNANERLKGKRYNKELIPFGECIHYNLIDNDQRKTKLEARWCDGVFLGMRKGSDEYLVGTKDEVYKTRSVRRKADQDKHDQKQLLEVRGLPWQPTPDNQNNCDILPAGTVIVPVTRDAPPDPILSDPSARRLYIKKQDIERYGAMVGCPGCDTIRRGSSVSVRHTDKC